MATTIEGDIELTLMDAVSDALAGTYAIAFPETTFTPPMDAAGKPQAYLEVAHLPNGNAYQPLGPGATRQGLLQVAVMYPKGFGPIKPKDAAGAVCAAFPNGSRFHGSLRTVLITSDPTTAQAFPDDNYIRVAVTIPYQA